MPQTHPLPDRRRPVLQRSGNLEESIDCGY
jgi:hypothetical protein